MPCYSPLKGFKSKETGGIVFKRSLDAGPDMEVACGQCLGCRLDRTRHWAARIVHEASEHEENCFITLTYDDEHLPYRGSLHKEHFQKFVKRLRKHFEGRRIRYYHCGEYGEELNRPHYHACFFNLGFPDKQLFQEREGNFLFVSQTLNKLWPYGFATIGEVTFESAAYVARYCLKKVTGVNSQEHYSRIDLDTGELYTLEPEYVTMSRRPGIGKSWYEKYKSDVFPSDEVPVPGKGVFKKPPRYYQELYRADDPLAFEALQKIRLKFKQAHSHEYSPQRLMDKYKVKKAATSLLKRGLENGEG